MNENGWGDGVAFNQINQSIKSINQCHLYINE